MKRCVVAVLGMSLVMAMGFATIAHADDYKSFGVRLRGIYVVPSEDVDHQLNGVTLSDTFIPEIDFEYFFTKNVSTELIAGVTRHDIKSDGNTIGSTWLLPPTLTVKWHPLAGSMFSPYLGVGINGTMPYHTHLNIDNTRTSIHNSIGWAAQVGLDYKVTESVFLNLDYKFFSADTKIVINGAAMHLDINPNLFGFGIGYRF